MVKTLPGTKRIDLTGQVFRHHKVLKFSHTRGKRAFWHVKCLLCEYEYVIQATALENSKYGCCKRCAFKKNAKNRAKFIPRTFD